MGTSYSYRCGQCGFALDAGKGRSAGFRAIVYAMRCRGCGYAGDIRVRGALPSREPNPDAELAALAPCPKCGRHDYEPWEPPYPCPKCATPMGDGDSVTMWD